MKSTRNRLPLLGLALGLALILSADLDAQGRRATEPGAAPATLTLLPAAEGDLAAPRALWTADDLDDLAGGIAGPEVSREPVSFTWALDPETAPAALGSVPTPWTGESRSYHLNLSAAELRAGVALPTTAPGALVHLGPAPESRGTTAELGLQGLVLTRGEDRWSGEQASSLMVDAAALQAAGAGFAAGTLAFRLDEALGAGVFRLQIPDLDSGREVRFTVQVLEPSSPVVARIRSDAAVYSDASTGGVDIDPVTGGVILAFPRARGFAVSPGGKVLQLDFVPKNGVLRAQLPLQADSTGRLGLWEVHASLTGEWNGSPVMRSLHTSFGVTVPTARLIGDATLSEGGSLAPRLRVQVGAAGRYEVRGVLFGTDAAGTLRPVAVAHSAAWLETGEGSLTLAFDPSVPAAAGVGAPFEVRHLELRDQGRMGLLQRQIRGLVLPE